MRESQQVEFEWVFRSTYASVLRTTFLILHDQGQAEEATQDAFVRLYERWGGVVRIDHPAAWVRKVAVNQRGSFLRAYLRQQTRERDAVARDEEDHIKLADDHAEVWQAVRTLPPLQAQVIALHYYEDYSGPTTVLPDPPTNRGNRQCPSLHPRLRRLGGAAGPSDWRSPSTCCWCWPSAS